MKSIGRTVIPVTLALLFPLTTGAATPRSPDFEMCRAQKQQKDCRRLSLAELDRLRGGMLLMSSIGPIEITFGITQAVYINNKLVTLTQFVLPGQTAGAAAPPSPAQIQTPTAALQQRASATPQSPPSASTGASTSTAPVPSAAQGSTPAATPVVTASPASSVAPAQTGLNTTLNSAQNSGGASARGQTVPSSQATANSSATASSVSPTVLVNGTAVTPGNPVINIPSANSLRAVIVQNGTGNIVMPSAANIASNVATIIQNTADNQAIRAVTEMNVSMAINRAMNAASISNAVRQGMITSRP